MRALTTSGIAEGLITEPRVTSRHTNPSAVRAPENFINEIGVIVSATSNISQTKLSFNSEVDYNNLIKEIQEYIASMDETVQSMTVTDKRSREANIVSAGPTISRVFSGILAIGSIASFVESRKSIFLLLFGLILIASTLIMWKFSKRQERELANQ